MISNVYICVFVHTYIHLKFKYLLTIYNIINGIDATIKRFVMAELRCSALAVWRRIKEFYVITGNKKEGTKREEVSAQPHSDIFTLWFR